MDSEEFYDYLAARGYVYLLFQRVFGSDPSKELFDSVDTDVADEAFKIVLAGDEAEDDSTTKFLILLKDAHLKVEEWRSEYTRLFVGPAALPAPPWESVYTSNKRLIMQPSTLEIRTIYRAQGFIPALYPHVPDDHIALELDFIATLAGMSLEAWGQQDEKTAQSALVVSESFITKHLGSWVGSFARELCEKGNAHYYDCAARALATFALADARELCAYTTSYTKGS